MIKLNKPQGEFLSVTEPFRAYVGGYRAGKTFVGCVRLWQLACAHPSIKLGYFAPTYPHIRDIFYTTMEEVAELYSDHAGGHCSVKVLKAEHIVKMYVNGELLATVMCKSMEHPARIVGFDISHALVDEIDIMKIDKADLAWKKIIARMSSVRKDYTVNTVDFTSTPEGFNWLYKFFIKKLSETPEMQQFYKLVKASTLENRKNLPADYIPKLYATYPSNLVDAYVHGEFVNLTSGTVYYGYTRDKNQTFATHDEGEPIHVGLDFNVRNMSAIVYVQRDGVSHAVDEICKGLDTDQVCQILQQRYPTESIIVYPDASGKNTSSKNASASDISIIKGYGITVKARRKNPFIKDRIISANKAFEDKLVLVNIEKCPNFALALEQQVYDKNGMPEKSPDDSIDDMNDAGTYYIHTIYPVAQRVPTAW